MAGTWLFCVPQSARTRWAVPQLFMWQNNLQQLWGHCWKFQPWATLFTYYSHLYIHGSKIQKVLVYHTHLYAKENLAVFPYTVAFEVNTSSTYLCHGDLWWCHTVSLEATRPWLVTNLCQTDLYPISLPVPHCSCSVPTITDLRSETFYLLLSCPKLSSRSSSWRYSSLVVSKFEVLLY